MTLLTIFTPAAAAGAQTITPDLLTNAQTFYLPTISGGGVVAERQPGGGFRHMPGGKAISRKRWRELEREFARAREQLETNAPKRVLKATSKRIEQAVEALGPDLSRFVIPLEVQQAALLAAAMASEIQNAAAIARAIDLMLARHLQAADDDDEDAMTALLMAA